MENDLRYKEENEILGKVKKIIFDEKQSHIKSLEKIPNEYKGRYSDVKWGDEDLVSNLLNMHLSRLNYLNNLEKSPYFGSFDFSLGGINKKRFRIGKTGIFDDKNNWVLDWRTPICTLYYDKSIGPVSYVSPRGEINGELCNKSQILIKDGEIKSIKDVDLVSDDELLQPYLNVNADNRMKNIIASIQSEQNSIIRKPMSKNLIVQGVAGSGKTSVALHRTAYLLYNCGNNINANNFIIIGPNKYFLNYISSVLPDLDTQSVKEKTFEDIVKKLINDDKYLVESSAEELDRYLNKMNKNVSIKSKKGTLEYKEAIDKFLNDYFNESLSSGLKYENIEIISGDKLKKIFEPKIGYLCNIKYESSRMTKELKEKWEDIYYELEGAFSSKNCQLNSDEKIKKLDAFKSASKKGFSDEIKQLLKPLLINPINLYKLFLERIDKYLNLSSDELDYIKIETLPLLKKKKIPYDDLAAVAYLFVLYNNVGDFDKYRHVVIDEAQDYNTFQLETLKTLFKRSTFSIFGDLAQGIYSYRSIKSWDDIKEKVFNNDCDFVKMEKSYRNTKEITNASNIVLDRLNLSKANPVIRTGETIKVIQVNDDNIERFYVDKIDNYLNNGYQSIGIICKDKDEINEVANILQQNKIEFNVINSKDDNYKAGISILTSYLSKGLEFDAIIINDASNTKYNSNSSLDMHLLYVAMTRALHDLVILYEDDLCNVLNNSNDIEYCTINSKKMILK